MEIDSNRLHDQPFNIEILKTGLHMAAVETSFGQQCLENIVKKLSNLFNIDFVFIGIYDKQKPNWIKTLAMCSHGEIIENLSYSLEGTPCADIMGKAMCLHSDCVNQLFPQDALLTEMGIKGYLGAPIFNAAAEGIGLLVLLQRGPLADSEEMQSIVQVYAARAGLEIDRMAYELELKRFNEILLQKDEDLVKAESIAKLGRWKWFIDEDKVYWSDVLKDIFGYPHEFEPNSLESIKKSGLFSLDSMEKLQRAIQILLDKGKSFEIELKFANFKGETGWILSNGQIHERDKDGRPTIMSGTAQDITEHKKLVNNLNSALKAKDLFLGVASHELKTPLSTMLLQIYALNRLLEKHGKDLPIEKIKDQSRMIQKQGYRFENLVNTLLDITQLNTGNLKFHVQSNVNLTDVAKDICLMFQEEFKQANTPFEVSIQSNIIGDWDSQRFGQVIANFLSNSLKYGQGKPVSFKLSMEKERICVEVRDHGIGISNEKKSKIFEKFSRGVDENAFKGFGLGLWIVNEIVKHVGGEVEVESELGKGSVFSTNLPLRIRNNENSS